MKKKIKIAAIAVAVFTLGLIGVNAATQTLHNLTNYQISANNSTGNNWTDTPNTGNVYAYAQMTANQVVGSGTKKTIYKGSIQTLGTWVTVQNKTQSWNTTQSFQTNIGYIGNGTWKLENLSTNYAGWKGTLVLQARSS